MRWKDQVYLGRYAASLPGGTFTDRDTPKKPPNIWKDSSVWACNNRYYVDGRSVVIPNSIYESSAPDEVISQLHAARGNNSSEAFNRYIDLFMRANHRRLTFLKDEAYQFIQNAAKGFNPEQIVVSFSVEKTLL